MIIALAGRRIDSSETLSPAFPQENIAIVRERLCRLYAEAAATALISSAACGADLIALQEAANRGLRCRVVLPFAPDRFRTTSVVDRPGEWGPIFDKVIDEVRSQADLVVLDSQQDDDCAYALVNREILDQAAMLGSHSNSELVAAVVREPLLREGPDFTREFAEEAQRRGLRLVEISTLR